MTQVERLPGKKLTQEVGQLYQSGFGFYSRMAFYDRSVEGPRDLHAAIIEDLRLKGCESILDAGCLDGRFLLTLCDVYGHEGPLIGVDISEEAIASAGLLAEARQHKSTPLRLEVADAADMDFLEDDSIDVATAILMLYHADEPENILRELQRVVRPGGRLAVATSGPHNKIRHREFESLIAEYLGCKPPERYARNFNTKIAGVVLEQLFTVEKVVHHTSPVLFYPRPDPQEGVNTFQDNDDLYAFRLSMQSSYENYDPIPHGTEWNKAYDAVVTPIIEAEIKNVGFFTDNADRCYWILANNKAA